MAARLAALATGHASRRVCSPLRELLDDQLPPLVEYLYSSVVNNFKGEIAELPAGPVIHRFAKRVGFPVSFVSGWAITEPKLKPIAWSGPKAPMAC